MELRQLEYLDAVVRHGGFGRAARETYVTQSALSQQITRLESELGLALLRRGPRGVEPTAAGREFLGHARAVLQEIAQARGAVAEHLDGTRGMVRIAATVHDSPRLPEALVAFHRAHPQVGLALQHGAAAQVADQLAAGAADVAVLAVADDVPHLPSQAEVEIVAEHRLWLLAPPGDALARRDEREGALVDLDELRGRPVIMPERGSALRALLTAAFAEAGFSPLPLLETGHPQTIRQLVLAGLGLGIVPASWLPEGEPPLATLRLDLPAHRLAVVAAAGPRVRARDLLLEHLLHALAEETPPAPHMRAGEVPGPPRRAAAVPEPPRPDVEAPSTR